MAELNEKKEKEIPDLEVLFDLADLFKVFGDSTRIRIMFAISDNEMSVLSIAEALKHYFPSVESIKTKQTC